LEGGQIGESYEQLLEEIQALPDAELVHINLDVPTAVTTALGALPEIRALRPQIKAELKSVDLARLDKLEAYALALFKAHTLYVTASRPVEPMAELVEEATQVRDMLYSDAMALVYRGFLDGEQLRGVKTGPGHRPLALDLMAVSAIMRASWSELKAKTAVQPAELSRAEELAQRLLNAIGQRDGATASVAESASIRQRAFALFVRAYDEVRRAVIFLRWHEGDAETIVPSLYAGRSTGPRKKTDPEKGTGTETKPGAKGADGKVDPTSDVTAKPGDMTGEPDGTPSTEIGLPGGEPFTIA
jgi:hypothetical protein